MVQRKKLQSSFKKTVMQTLNATYHTNGSKSKLDISVNKTVPQELLEEIIRALKTVEGYGSIEIYVQGYSVTQITVRNIRKTKHALAE